MVGFEFQKHLVEYILWIISRSHGFGQEAGERADETLIVVQFLLSHVEQDCMHKLMEESVDFAPLTLGNVVADFISDFNETANPTGVAGIIAVAFVNEAYFNRLTAAVECRWDKVFILHYREFDLRGSETRTRTGLTALPYNLFQTKVLLLDDGDFGTVTLNFFNHLVDGRVAGLLHDVVHAGRLEDDGNVGAVDAGVGLDLNIDGLATLEHGDAEGELLGDVGLDGLTEGVVAVAVFLILADNVLSNSCVERCGSLRR